MLKDRIANLCKEHGISITRLEHECGLAHATILKWEHSSPTLANAQKVADYFGISLWELVGHYDG